MSFQYYLANEHQQHAVQVSLRTQATLQYVEERAVLRP